MKLAQAIGRSISRDGLTLFRSITADRERAISVAIISLIVLALGLSTLISLGIVVGAYHPFLFQDQWETVELFDRYLSGTLTFRDLIAQHNEHRILIPRLIFLADLIFADARNTVNYAAIMVIQVAHAVAFYFVLASRVASRALLAASMMFVVALLFCLAQYENLIWGFQVQFVGVYLCFTLSACALASAQQRQRAGRRYRGLFVLGLFIGESAALMMSNGAAALLCVAVVFALVGWRNSQTAIIAAVGVVVFAAYALTFTPNPGHTSPYYSITHPLELSKHFTAYLGSFVAPWNLTAAMLLGLVGFLTWLVVFFSMGIRRAERHWAEIVLVSIMSFVVASAGLTALSRAGFGAAQGASSRYATPSTIFWAALISFIVILIGGGAATSPRRTLRVLALLAVVSVIVSFPLAATQLAYFPMLQQRVRMLDRARDAAVVGVDDDGTLRFVYPDVSRLKRLISIAKSRDISAFAEVRPWRMGSKVATDRLVENDRCVGEVHRLEMVPETNNESYEVEGWSQERASGKSLRRLVFMTEGQEVIGYGTAINAARFRHPGLRAREWSGYVRSAGGRQVVAFGVLPGDRLCRIASASVTGAPAIHSKAVELAALKGLSLVRADVRIEGQWAPNGQDPLIGKPSVEAAVYGSWVGDDSHTGVLTYKAVRFRTPSAVLLIATGPDTHGIRIELVDAGRRDVLATLRPAVHREWGALELEIPQEIIGKSIDVLVHDEGVHWGQWLAVGGLFVADR